MHTIIPLRKRVAGYGECWYCGSVVVDPRQYRVDDYGGDPLTFACCNRRRCNDRRRDGDLDPFTDEEG